MICHNCGIVELGTADTYGLCYKCKPNSQYPTVYNPGWVCPKCGAVYGPFVHECGRCNGPMEITC